MESDMNEVRGESGVHWSTNGSRIRSKMMELNWREVRGENGVNLSTNGSRKKSKMMESDRNEVRGEVEYIGVQIGVG